MGLQVGRPWHLGRRPPPARRCPAPRGGRRSRPPGRPRRTTARSKPGGCRYRGTIGAGRPGRLVNAPWPDYTAPYRIRFDEAGPDGRIRTSVLLRYAQDVAWLHSISRGFGRDWYRERGVNWVVRAVDLEVLSPIGLGDVLAATTHVVGHRRVWARRQCEFRSDDRPVARVRTDWLLI